MRFKLIESKRSNILQEKNINFSSYPQRAYPDHLYLARGSFSTVKDILTDKGILATIGNYDTTAKSFSKGQLIKDQTSAYYALHPLDPGAQTGTPIKLIDNQISGSRYYEPFIAFTDKSGIHTSFRPDKWCMELEFDTKQLLKDLKAKGKDLYKTHEASSSMLGRKDSNGVNDNDDTPVMTELNLLKQGLVKVKQNLAVNHMMLILNTQNGINPITTGNKWTINKSLLLNKQVIEDLAVYISAGITGYSSFMEDPTVDFNKNITEVLWGVGVKHTGLELGIQLLTILNKYANLEVDLNQRSRLNSSSTIDGLQYIKFFIDGDKRLDDDENNKNFDLYKLITDNRLTLDEQKWLLEIIGYIIFIARGNEQEWRIFVDYIVTNTTNKHAKFYIKKYGKKSSKYGNNEKIIIPGSFDMKPYFTGKLIIFSIGESCPIDKKIAGNFIINLYNYLNGSQPTKQVQEWRDKNGNFIDSNGNALPEGTEYFKPLYDLLYDTQTINKVGKPITLDVKPQLINKYNNISAFKNRRYNPNEVAGIDIV